MYNGLLHRGLASAFVSLISIHRYSKIDSIITIHILADRRIKKLVCCTPRSALFFATQHAYIYVMLISIIHAYK